MAKASKKNSREADCDWLHVPVSLLALVSLAVAQSVYEVLASNQTFLDVRRVSNTQLLGIIAVFNFLPALVLFLFWALICKLHRGLARAFLSIVYFLLFLAFFLQIHNAYLSEWQPLRHSYLLWGLPAALLLFASLRFEKPFRSFVLALSPAVLIFPFLFLSRTWTNPKDLLPGENPLVQQEASQVDRKSFPPIFLIIFDEFTTHALLDDNGQIDGERFPNFKTLAGESYWFRNATANSGQTIRSIPIILTGTFSHGSEPSYEAYPNNLLSLLRPYYEIYVYEAESDPPTRFCVPRLFHCPDSENISTWGQLLQDILYIYLTRASPTQVDLGLPDVTNSWGAFKGIRERTVAHVARFQRFLQSLGKDKRDDTLHVFFHGLPHSPYTLTREGKIYEASPSRIEEKFAGNKPLLRALRDRFLMQVEYVDTEMGQFVTLLKDSDLYDKALIVVTADHGISWNPEAPGRRLTRVNAGMILPVPLFIKVPDQMEGVTSDLDVQHIDLVPTIAGILGLRVPWQHQGRNAFQRHLERRKKIASGLEFSDTLGLAPLGVDLAVQESSLVGKKIELFDVKRDDTVRGRLDRVADSSDSAGQGDLQFPVYVYGWVVSLDKESIPEEIAIAVNGKIVAVTSPCCERPDVAKHFQNHKFLMSGWSTSFSNQEFKDGRNTVTAYVVLDANARKLAVLQASKNTIQVTRK